MTNQFADHLRNATRCPNCWHNNRGDYEQNYSQHDNVTQGEAKPIELLQRNFTQQVNRGYQEFWAGCGMNPTPILSHGIASFLKESFYLIRRNY